MEQDPITEFGTERTAEQRLNMQQVIDWLAKGAPHTVLKDGSVLDGFNYSNYIEASGDNNSTTGQCGTVGCIAGAAVQFDSPVPVSDGRPSVDFIIEDKARELLGLGHQEAELLFYPFNLDYRRLKVIYSVDGLSIGGAYDRPLEIGCGDMLEDEDYRIEALAELEYAEPEQIARVLQLFQDTGVINWYILEVTNG
jgi:hypothetical protein